MPDYMALLKDRMPNVYNALKGKLNFYTDEPERLKILKLASEGDPRVRTDSREYSDGQFPAYYDPRFPSFNVNQFADGYFVCEGPIQKDTDSMQRFIKNTFFNPQCSIKYVIVAGEPNQGHAKFHDYFSCAGKYGEYEIKPTSTEKLSPNINLLKLTVSSEGEEKQIQLFHLVNMPDHDIAELGEEDFEILYKISLIEPNNLLAHCAAGLGRSPTILFSFILFEKFSEIFLNKDTTIAKRISENLNAIRKIRPAAIQQPKQLEQAIQLSLKYKQIDWKLDLDKKTVELKSLPTICIIGAFDTKNADYLFVYEQIIQHGYIPLTINTGVFEKEVSFPVDIDVKEKLTAAAANMKAIITQGRPSAVAAIKTWVKNNITNIFKKTPFHGVIGLGGTNGTDIITSAMRELPRAMPKVCVSTVAQHENWAYTETSEIIMVNSVTDVDGINKISQPIYEEAVVTITRLAKKYKISLESPLSRAAKKPAIAITMFGNTTSCVDKCKEILTNKGFECLTFHAVGSGGKGMEKLIDEGVINAVLDITTTEIADLVGNGVFSAGPDRLSAAGKKGIPQVIIPGCLDMINLAKFEPEKYPGRKLMECNENVTIMRTTVAENKEMAELIANKANVAKGPVAILLPLKSLSLSEQTFTDWHDEDANQAFFTTLKNHVRKDIPIVEVDAHINDPGFSENATGILLDLYYKQKEVACPNGSVLFSTVGKPGSFSLLGEASEDNGNRSQRNLQLAL